MDIVPTRVGVNRHYASRAGYVSFVKTSNPKVLMMQPTENRDRYDAAEPL